MGISKMQKIEQERGKPIKDVLQELYPVYGSQVKLAEALGVTQPTISLWFTRLGLKPTTELTEKAS